MARPLSERISKRQFLRVAVLGAAATAVAACSPAAPATSTSAPPKPAETAKPAAAATPAEATKPGGTTQPAAQSTSANKGGTFTYAEAGDFNNFNPWNFSAVNFEMYDQVFSRLLWKDGAAKANPDLAESWQLAPDNLSITLKLRGGLKWHDGKAVTAQDFVDTYAYLKDPGLATSSRKASAARIGIRCALKVPLCTAAPLGETASMTSRRPAKALSGVPPPSALPSVHRSGVTPRYPCRATIVCRPPAAGAGPRVILDPHAGELLGNFPQAFTSA